MSVKFDELVSIMDKLRAPNGCPWDREQTIDSLKKYLLEETYELLEELEVGDQEKIKEELGNLLLQVIFLSRLYKEESKFTIEDVIENISTKLKARHPHIFADLNASDSNEVLRIWEEQKKKEKRKDKFSVVDGIPKSQPALLRAQQISERVARVGFEWEDISDVMSKVKEELAELEAAIKSKNKERTLEEIGDLLFTITNIARHLKIDSELSLHRTCRKFDSRWRYIENKLREIGKKPRESSLDEMESYWAEA